MPSLTCFKFRFTLNWLMIVLALLFISLFTSLGCWQLSRGNLKEQMITQQATSARLAPASWEGQEQGLTEYQRVKVSGKYLPQIFLLDNQHYQHQFGYDVISPLLLSNGQVVLVDRGWILGDRSRTIFPKIEHDQNLREITGIIYFPKQNQWVLGPNMEKKGEKLAIIEMISPKLMTQVLQKKVYPFIIRLDKQETDGFIRDWVVVTMSPERHFAYAMQWFAMALVILIICIALGLKKDEKTII